MCEASKSLFFQLTFLGIATEADELSVDKSSMLLSRPYEQWFLNRLNNKSCGHRQTTGNYEVDLFGGHKAMIFVFVSKAIIHTIFRKS